MAKKVRIKVDSHEIIRVQKKPTGSTKQVNELKLQRRRLYSQKYYWVNKWKEAKRPRQAKQAFERAQKTQVKLNKLNSKLGVTYELPKLPKKHYYKDGLRRDNVNIWEGIKMLRRTIKAKFYKKIIIESKSYSIKYPTKIFNAYDKLEKLAYKIPRNTPRIEFIYDNKTKAVTITIF